MKDFTRAKQIFFECYGSMMWIDREYGKEYRKYKVPSEMESVWKDEIIEKLKLNIDFSYGYEQFTHVNHLCQVISIKEQIDLLITLLERGSDSFTVLLYCESLKRLLNSISEIELKERIMCKIFEEKKILLSKQIDFDERYKRELCLKNYDLSEKTIRKRIEEL